MVRKTLIRQRELENIIDNYEDYTDKYFLRGKTILTKEGINPIVRYQVFARQDVQELKGVDEAAYFIKKTTGDKAKVYALRNGQNYQANTPLMKIEGRVQNLIDLETVYLGILAGELTGQIDMDEVREKAKAIKTAARDKPVLYFGARHFHPALDEQIARICYEEGFAGTSTDIGAKAWNAKGQGTIPHALILAYRAYLKEQGIQGNPTIEATKAFDKYIDKKVPRIALIDTFNKEIDDTLATARAVPNLDAVRIDTCGENYAQGARETNLPELPVTEKYLQGKGVTIQAVWKLRTRMIVEGFRDIGLVLSSGFNPRKTRNFMIADQCFQENYNKPLFTAIGTGSLAHPIMTTSDIVAYYNEKQGWLPNSKKGRAETSTKRLEEIK